MHLYLPVALTSIHILLPLVLGLVVGLLSGIFGVGGGFLITPLLIMLGIPSTVAAATGSNQIIAASTTGTYAHWKAGNVDFKMGIYLIAGSFSGGLLGVQLVKILRLMGNADFVIKTTYVLMLGGVGTYMLIESLSGLRKNNFEEIKEEKESRVEKFLKALPLQTSFEKSGVAHSILAPLAIGSFIGVLTAIMGVGGGFLMVPVMVYLLGMPMHVIIGTSLFQILFTCIEVAFLQAYVNHTVDFILALPLIFGSALGAQAGVIIGRRLNAEHLKFLLALIVLAVTVKIILELTLSPSLLLSPAGGH